MVKITKKGFTIEVETDSPANDYVEITRDLIDLLSKVDPELRGENNYTYAHELLKQMVPLPKQAECLLQE